MIGDLVYYYVMFLFVSAFASPVVASFVVAAAASQHTVVRKNVALLQPATVNEPAIVNEPATVDDVDELFGKLDKPTNEPATVDDVDEPAVVPSFPVPPTLAPPDAKSTTAAATSGTSESDNSVDQKIYTSGSMSHPGGIQSTKQPPMVQAMNSTVPPLLDTNSTTAPISNKPSSVDKSIYTSGSMSHPGGKLTSTPPAFQPQTESAKRDALALKNMQDAQRRSAAVKRAKGHFFDAILGLWKLILYAAHSLHIYIFLGYSYAFLFPVAAYCSDNVWHCAIAGLFLGLNLIMYAVLQENAETKLQETAYAIINGTILFAILRVMVMLKRQAACNTICKKTKIIWGKFLPGDVYIHGLIWAVLVDMPWYLFQKLYNSLSPGVTMTLPYTDKYVDPPKAPWVPFLGPLFHKMSDSVSQENPTYV